MNRTENQRKALGKGLGALLPTRHVVPQPPPQAPTQPPPQAAAAEPPPETIAIELIDPNPVQPRRAFQEDRLEELAQSIRANGIIQPLVVRKAGERYQLVAGERRLRAAKLAGVQRVPAVIRDIADGRLLEVTLIENIQREDLNPIETAHAFDRLGQELQMNAELIGRQTGKDRTTITNFLRLLQLPPEVQNLVSDGKLSGGAARAICGLPNAKLQIEVAHKAASGEWPVRQLERLVQKLRDGDAETVEAVRVDPNVKAATEELERALGTRVRIIEKSKKRGRIEIDFYSEEDRDRIYSLIVRE